MPARGAGNNGGQRITRRRLKWDSKPYDLYDNHYRDWIRSVAMFGVGGHIRTTLFSQSGHSGSSYSNYSGSSSYLSNNSGCSSASASAAAVELGVRELTRIARQMARDGYTQCLVQAFDNASPAAAFDYGDGPVFDWLIELNFGWDFDEHVSLPLQLQDKSASELQEWVERWIRALTVIAVSITELVVTVPIDDNDEMLAVARFGKASMAEMLVFVDAFIHALKAGKLQSVLHMYTCVSRAWRMFTSAVISPGNRSIFNEIAGSLEKEVKRLSEAAFSAMEEVKTLMEDDDSWAIEIPRGRGEVHNHTRLMVDCVLSARVHDTGHLSDMIQATLNYLKDLLLRKSELYSDPSLRYMFLLNNSYFAAQMIEPCQPGHDWKLTPECEKYMFTYLDVSWGHVLSCIPKSHFPGPLHRWISTSSLVKFESAFHKTYQAQKFWKVPDPRLRDELRRAITARVISGYREYLGEHPELQKHIGLESSSPEVLEEMLVELFEG